jgi:hypothetical protein
MEEEGAGYVIFYINDLLCVCVTGHSTNCVFIFLIFIPPLPEGGGGYIVLHLSVLPSIQDIFHRIFLSNLMAEI